MTITTLTPSKRILSIDILRGIVMVVMALDHTRDYFTNITYEPTDLQHASTILFFTRWITHFCAPVFVFLTGTSAFLSMGKATKKEAAFKLLTRGLWLILLEVTVVRFGWMFDVSYKLIILQVIWAIGVSMVAMSGLIFLPRSVVLAIGLLMIFGHDAFDTINFTGNAAIVWDFLHVQTPLPLGQGRTLFIIYPLVPWVGVMATGYCFGALFKIEEARRNKLLLLTGLGAVGLFIILRVGNIYGDPNPWVPQARWWRSVLSVLNCSKYPPSLLYLLMTLGLSITSLPLLEKMTGAVGRVFLVYGRVPMFYYILHLYLLHIMSLVIPRVFGGGTEMNGLFHHPGYSLPMVYVFWLLAVGILYLPCRWFMNVKMHNKAWWLSYL